MRVDRNAPAVVADRHVIVGAELEFHPRGMVGDNLVHRVVDNLGGQMVQGAFVRATDIHAGPFPDGLQPLQNFNILSGIILGLQRFFRSRSVGLGFLWRVGEQVMRNGHGATFSAILWI